VRAAPGAGAAGGLGAGLIAFTGARLRAGIDVVMEAVGLRGRLMRADLVITGEGQFDEQSLHGKTVAGVIRAAEDRRVGVMVLCGRAEVRPEGLSVASLVERFGEREALENTRLCLESLAQEVAATMPLGSSPRA
jgi:glycerate kinase